MEKFNDVTSVGITPAAEGKGFNIHTGRFDVQMAGYWKGIDISRPECSRGSFVGSRPSVLHV
jgi:hypothetical protein